MNEEENLKLLDVAVFILSIYVLVVTLVETFFVLPVETTRLLQYFDFPICIFFLIEFSIRLSSAKNKWKFMRWGWIDLLASIPMLHYFHYGRIFRVVRLLRAVRAMKKTPHVLAHFRNNKVNATVESAALIGVLITIFATIVILQVETAPDSNIRTAEDAIWWAIVTISTVGYGDKFPVTNLGRMVGIFLIIVGVGLFGVFTAYIASLFVYDDQHRNDPNNKNNPSKLKKESKD